MNTPDPDPRHAMGVSRRLNSVDGIRAEILMRDPTL